MDKIFKALADKNRRKILTLIKEKEMSVMEILKYLNIGQATLSSHLSILKKAGVVNCRVDGKKRIYKWDVDVLMNFVKELSRFMNVNSSELSNEIIIRKKSF